MQNAFTDKNTTTSNMYWGWMRNNCLRAQLPDNTFTTKEEELPESIRMVRGKPSKIPWNCIVLGAGAPLTAFLDRAKKSWSDWCTSESNGELQSSTDIHSQISWIACNTSGAHLWSFDHFETTFVTKSHCLPVSFYCTQLGVHGRCTIM
jgi:hypothetical protein